MVNDPDCHSREWGEMAHIVAIGIRGKDMEIFVATAVLEEEDMLIALPEVGGNIPFRDCRDSTCFAASGRLHPNVQSILVRTQKGNGSAARRNLISRPFRITKKVAKWDGRANSMFGKLSCGTHGKTK